VTEELTCKVNMTVVLQITVSFLCFLSMT
jgi:hypothetical protein